MSPLQLSAEPSIRDEPCLTADLKQAARRPLKSGLRIDKLVRDTGFSPRDVEGQLRRSEEPSYRNG